MTPRRGGLGRGLGALIPSGPAVAASGSSVAAQPAREANDAQALREAPGASYREIPVGQIEPNPQQPRSVFDEEALEELAASVREVGVLQPVVVRQIRRDRYQLIMGERRLRAATMAGLAAIPAILRETGDDVLLRDALLENLHRQQLNPLEEAAAFEQLLAEFGATHEELASRIGKSRSYVTNTLRLMNLPPAVQRRVAAGVLSAGHARAILMVNSAEAQEVLATRIVAEGLSVRAAEEAATLLNADPRQQRKHRASRSARTAPPALGEAVQRLAERLDTRVKLDLGRNKGRLVIEFAGEEDLARIISGLAPDLPRGTEP